MNFLALNDDAKFIIVNHLKSDYKINKIFMTEQDDKLQKILFDEVKEMTMTRRYNEYFQLKIINNLTR